MVALICHVLGCLCYTVGTVYYVTALSLLIADHRKKQRE